MHQAGLRSGTAAVSQAELSAVARQLNENLRKTFQYQTPAEKFEACVAVTR
jgi:IS30 family transposase